MFRAVALVLLVVLLTGCTQGNGVSEASTLPAINDLGGQQDFSVYNDIRSDNFIVVFQSPRAGKASVSVYYEDGRMLSRREFAVNKGLNTWNYKQKFASGGIYIVQLIMNKMERSCKIYKTIS